MRYLRSLLTWWESPLVAYHLGQAYQAEGDVVKARQMLAYFTENWAHADPDLQPLVEDARARLDALAPDRN